MKHYNLLIIILLWTIQGNAQDIITTKKGEDIQAKVLEITLKEIKYKKFDNPNSPVYTLLKSDVLLVRYENGSKDIFQEEDSSKNKNSIPNLINMADRRYYINGNRVSLSELRRVIYKDSQAKAIWQKSQGLMVGYAVCSIASVGFSLYGISDLLGKIEKQNKGEYSADTNWTPFIVAAGLLVPSIVFYNLSYKAKVDAIETYNRNLQEKKVTFSTFIDANGVGVSLRF
ncbi:conserved exported hypothetical protein [Capnocytophaga canimorsus]|uniref:Uncharacterized protein n=1 Tax=Capnocytophaga canimorsus TaxID=28188 RepID=A0A0B7IRD0_9FLAO|nr:hypothetical protein [Capnocytophaga canimorsus]CEN52518.1 conserved exported hypothetical protein [Capnocytophaga canimorsus]